MRFGYLNTVKNFIEEFSNNDGKEKFAEILSSVSSDDRQVNAWSGLFNHVYNLFLELENKNLGNIYCIFEYQLPFSDERIDLILIGKKNDKPTALVFELKGWTKIDQINRFTVKVGNQIYQNPELQIKNYLGKLKYTHSASTEYEFKGFLWFYNLDRNSNLEIDTTTYYRDEISRIAKDISNLVDAPINYDDLKKFIEGQYIQSTRLFDAIRLSLTNFQQDVINALSTHGFGLTESQSKLINEILEAIKSGNKKAFFIQGSAGSGKTYLALILLFEIIKNFGNNKNNYTNLVALGYRNNRLINVLRNLFNFYKTTGLSSVLKYYSTGNNNGLAEGNPQNPHYKVVIYDEAQRMTKENISIALQRGDITVFFYDENQILNADEDGWRANFICIAKKLRIPFEEKQLNGVYRVKGGKEYHEFIENLLNEKNPNISFKNYEFKIFNCIEQMLHELRDKVSNNHKVALVASFTESPGDWQNRTYKNDKNRRVGYRLYSGFEHYKNSNVEIYWLMDEKTQYPEFWIDGKCNELTHCASIYGCQGFEADFIGLIWGRDFVWRDGEWVTGDGCMDNIGGQKSLKNLMDKESVNYNPQLAKRLLINRYRIFLTRGILGTYIYCEDEETRDYLKSLVSS